MPGPLCAAVLGGSASVWSGWGDTVLSDELAGAGHGQGDATLILEVAPDEEEWGSRNDKWQLDLFTLRQELERAVPDSVEELKPGEGQLGLVLVPIIVALGSSGAFTAALSAFKAWLAQRPVHRRINVKFKIGDTEGEVTIDADNVASNGLTAVANEVLKSKA